MMQWATSFVGWTLGLARSKWLQNFSGSIYSNFNPPLPVWKLQCICFFNVSHSMARTKLKDNFSIFFWNRIWTISATRVCIVVCRSISEVQVRRANNWHWTELSSESSVMEIENTINQTFIFQITYVHAKRVVGTPDASGAAHGYPLPARISR